MRRFTAGKDNTRSMRYTQLAMSLQAVAERAGVLPPPSHAFSMESIVSNLDNPFFLDVYRAVEGPFVSHPKVDEVLNLQPRGSLAKPYQVKNRRAKSSSDIKLPIASE
jgi:hypothetical protein